MRRDPHRIRGRAAGAGALLLLGAALVLLSVPVGPLHRAAEIAAQEVETRTVALDEGWNLLGWTGPETPFLDAVAAIVDQTEAAAAFDGGAQAFRNWNASAPALLNSLITLREGEAVWLRVSEPVDWVQPVVADPGPLALHAGFNLVTWTGPSGLEPAESFAGIAAALNAAFAFDSAVEAFTSFGPSRPGFLNDLTPLIYGDGFWALMDATATWSQPAAPEPAAVSLPDGSVRMEIPRGALPPGVQASDITITDSPDGPRPIVEGADFLRAVQLEPSGLTFARPVFLEARVLLAPGAIPLPVLLSAERGVEFLPGATIALDPEDRNRAFVRIPLPHFSGVTLFAGGSDAFGIPEPIEAGDPAALVTTRGEPIGRVELLEGFVAFAHFIGVDFDFTVTFTAPEDFIPDERGSSVESYVAEQTLRVTAPGRFIVQHSGYRVLAGAATRINSDSELGGEFDLLPGEDLLELQKWECTQLGLFTLATVRADFEVASFAAEGSEVAFRSIADAVIALRVPPALMVGECVPPPPPGFFGFLSADGDGVVGPDEEIQDDPPLGEWIEILVADPTTPLADPGRFPITMTVEVNGVLQQTLLIEDPVADCANSTVCSGHLEALEAMPGDIVTITATDAKGAVVAFQSLTVPG